MRFVFLHSVHAVPCNSRLVSSVRVLARAGLREPLWVYVSLRICELAHDITSLSYVH